MKACRARPRNAQARCQCTAAPGKRGLLVTAVGANRRFEAAILKAQLILSTTHERTTKTLSVSMPPNQFKDMERGAKKENRTMSELVRELYRRYVSEEARREFGRALLESSRRSREHPRRETHHAAD